ncbi:hypothetical protein X777_08305 [Ooceraea biroi]|uniref:Uncharacterized protein n=1 Tax=Ooceraea biroi TaxID=2015173 RepID=A0A026WZ51_OOCBI|nr:hypothetical protein X777_08305 [Ooceraea biroi]
MPWRSPERKEIPVNNNLYFSQTRLTRDQDQNCRPVSATRLETKGSTCSVRKLKDSSSPLLGKEIDSAEEDTGDSGLSMKTDRGLRRSPLDTGSESATETFTHLLGPGCPSISGVFMDSRTPSLFTIQGENAIARDSKWIRAEKSAEFSVIPREQRDDFITGASTGETEDPRSSTYSTRKTRSSLPRAWPSSSVEHTAREIRPSSGKLPETTPWSVDRSSPGTRSDLSFLGTVAERSEEDEDGTRLQPSGGNDIGSDATVARHNPSISSRSGETSQTDPLNRIPIESPSARFSTIGHRAGTSPAPAGSHDIVPMPEKLSRGNSQSTTPKTMSSKNIGMPRRQMRHVPDICEKFQIGDEVKREFYSPNYPEAYPNQTDCVRVLEGKSLQK